MKKFLLILTIILISVLFCSCKKPQEQLQSTPEIFQPTRSVATVPLPTKASTCTNIMKYVGDSNYEDGSVLAPGTKFTKEWEVINYGDCQWNDSYHLFFISGNQMGAPAFVNVPHIPVGSKGKVSVDLTAPEEPGKYHSEWKLFGSDNRFFGESLIVDIIVADENGNYYGYDYSAE